jgi:hypothetical protein
MNVGGGKKGGGTDDRFNLILIKGVVAYTQHSGQDGDLLFLPFG